MKTFIAILAAILVSGMMVNASAAGRLQHVVSFKFKATATAQDIKKVEEAFQALKGKIPQIVALEWGTNVSKEKKDKGFTHCFVLLFKSEQDLETYIGHPEHKAFGKIVGPLLDDVFVIDFWAKP
jgi:Stress responsive A/B Barrel Domain